MNKMYMICEFLFQDLVTMSRIFWPLYENYLIEKFETTAISIIIITKNVYRTDTDIMFWMGCFGTALRLKFLLINRPTGISKHK